MKEGSQGLYLGQAPQNTVDSALRPITSLPSPSEAIQKEVEEAISKPAFDPEALSEQDKRLYYGLRNHERFTRKFEPDNERRHQFGFPSTTKEALYNEFMEEHLAFMQKYRDANGWSTTKKPGK